MRIVLIQWIIKFVFILPNAFTKGISHKNFAYTVLFSLMNYKLYTGTIHVLIMKNWEKLNFHTNSVFTK